MRTPSARSACSVASTCALFSSSSVSVISSSSRRGGRPDCFSASVTTESRLPLRNWSGDRLTATRTSSGQCRGVEAGPAQHQVAERDDQAGFLGDRNELGRRDHAALGMRPAHQRLEAGDAAALRGRPAAGSERRSTSFWIASRRSTSSRGALCARHPSRPRRSGTCRLPSALARYSAMSAFLSSLSESSPSPGASAMPMLAPITTVAVEHDRARRWPRAGAWRAPPHPPGRVTSACTIGELVAAEPRHRVLVAQRRAQPLGDTAAAACRRPRWPSVSLTALKLSRSMHSIATLVGRCAAMRQHLVHAAGAAACGSAGRSARRDAP